MVRVQAEPFDPAAELAAFARGRTDVGGIATFLGLVRDEHGGERVSAMTLEHYPGMTERKLAEIEAEARARWPDLQDTLVIHRHGRMLPGEPIVLVATGQRPPPGRARRLRLPDRLAEDQGAVLEARGDRRRRALGRGPRERRPGGGAVGAPGAVTGRRQPSARLASTKSRKARTLAGGRWREGW